MNGKRELYTIFTTILSFILLLSINRSSLAQSEWSGGYNITGDIPVNLTADVYLKQVVVINSGATLTIQNGTNSPVTIYNGDNNTTGTGNRMFQINQGGTLIIQGAQDKQIILDGRAGFEVNGDGYLRFDSKPTNSTKLNEAILNKGTLSLEYVTIRDVCGSARLENGKDDNNGGAIYVSDATGKTTIKNSTITLCYAMNGSAIHIPVQGTNNSDDCAVLIENSTISQCGTWLDKNDTWGGTIRTQGATQSNLTLKNVTFDHNISTNGAGIYWNAAGGTAKCSIDGCTFQNNISTWDGGALFMETTFEFTGGKTTIRNNQALGERNTNKGLSGRGGGIYIGGYEGDLIKGGDFTFDLSDKVEVTDNSAKNGGGGVVFYFGKLGYSEDTRITAKINGCNISSNIAGNEGGGINFFDDPLYHNDKVELLIELNSGTLSGNTASEKGGAIYVDGINISSSQNQDDNISISANSITGEGGLGGAIYVTNGNVTLGNSTINDNSATKGNGGGLYVDEGTLSKGTLSIASSKVASFESNKAKDGGAAYVNGTVTVDGTANITSNQASEDGGGIFVNNGDFTVTGQVNISSNTSAGKGAGAYIGAGTVSIKSCSISNNTATGDGGGLYLGSGTLSIGDDAGNTIKGNSAANGAGVCIANGSLSVNKCDISDNIASNYGGGVYVMNTSSTSITLSGGGVFERNSAKAGGGLAVGGAINLSFEGTIQSNKATNGGGVYLFKDESSGTRPKLTFQGGYIRNNQATGNIGDTGKEKPAKDIGGFGGGIFLDAGSTFTTNITGDAVFGFYGNMANQGADDIFANGSSTSITIPDVANMRLNDYDVQTNELYWVEDFVHGDIGYNQLTSGNGQNDYPEQRIWRYRELLNQNSTYIPTVKAGIYTGYTCLTLGYSLVFVEVTRFGLKSGDTAPYQISYKKNDQKTPYNKIIFIGQGDHVSRNIALPSGDWIFEELDWGWKYDHTKATYEAENDSGTWEKYPSEPNDPNSYYIHIQTNQNTKIRITNYQIENANSQVGFEYNVINRLKND